MALDLSAIKAKLAKATGKGNEYLFKPEEGDQRVRVVPLESSPENPFQELYFHWGFAGKNILSPLSYGERDPIAEFSDAIIASNGGKMSKEDFKQAKQFYPQIRTYLPIVVRGKEHEGIKFWAFGQQIYTQLLEIMADDEYGDITDVENGWDIKVTFTPKEKSDTNYAKTTIRTGASRSPLTKDTDLKTKLLTNQPKLIDVIGYQKYSYDDLNDMLNKVVTGPAQTTTTSDVEWATNEPTVTKSAEGTQEVSPELQSKFNSVFGG